MAGGRSAVAIAVLLAVAVTVVTAYLFVTWRPEPPRSNLPGRVTTTAPADRTPSEDPAPVAPGGPIVVVVGDSFSSGTAANTGPEWPQILGQSLGWDVVNEAAGGTGYLAPGAAGRFGERVDDVTRYAPDIVILAGGINDLRFEPGAVAAAADRVIDRLKKAVPNAEVVVLSPFSDGDPRPVATAVSDRLREVAETHDVAYIDVTGYLPLGQGLLGGDGFHPANKGHRRIAELLEEDLEALGFEAATPQSAR